jgi:hypothetical protein
MPLESPRPFKTGDSHTRFRFSLLALAVIVHSEPRLPDHSQDAGNKMFSGIRCSLLTAKDAPYRETAIKLLTVLQLGLVAESFVLADSS